MKKLLVSAYAFSPSKGSEFAQGWNYVLEASKHFDVTVLIGSSDGIMGEFNEIRQWCNKHTIPFKLVEVSPPRTAWIFNLLNERLHLTWLFVFALDAWHKKALRVAKELHERYCFDFAHQLGPVGFRNPGYLYELNIPSYWGPIGGAQYINLRLAFKSSFRYGLLSAIRNAQTFLAIRSSRVKRAVESYSRVSYATLQNKKHFCDVYGIAGPIISDQACFQYYAEYSKCAPEHGGLSLVWCGSVDDRKNIKLALSIAERLMRVDVPVALTVIGDGHRLLSSQSHAEKMGLRNIKFTGQVSRSKVDELLSNADVLLFTSLSEANTATFFEGLQNICIPVTLDLDGFSTNINNSFGFKISTKQKYDDIVSEYVCIIEELASNTEKLESLRANLSSQVEQMSWKYLFERHHRVLHSAQNDD